MPFHRSGGCPAICGRGCYGSHLPALFSDVSASARLGPHLHRRLEGIKVCRQCSGGQAPTKPRFVSHARSAIVGRAFPSKKCLKPVGSSPAGFSFLVLRAIVWEWRSRSPAEGGRHPMPARTFHVKLVCLVQSDRCASVATHVAASRMSSVATAECRRH